LAINAVTAIHSARIIGPETIGVSHGHAEELFYLQAKVLEQGASAIAQPVVAGSLRMRMTSGAALDDGWVEAPNWDRTGPFDRQFLVDPTDNSVRFGNGRIGRVPSTDWAIQALEYRVGGGRIGNLAAGRLTHVVAGGSTGVSVLQPFAAVGGAEAETIDQAHGRTLAMLAKPRRGVTVSDWIALALQTPGVPVARAMAIPGYLSALGCWTAPGVVTLVVVPACGRPPQPGADFLAAVTAFLEPRRPLTTELHVVGPHYVQVTIEATLHVSGPAARTAASAQRALDTLFDPLIGGPDATGWPFGRGVLASDVAEVLAQLPGVVFVDDIVISSNSGAIRCDNLSLCPTDLIASQIHQISVVEA
jgi:predicted phage baseplate assembly protein